VIAVTDAPVDVAAVMDAVVGPEEGAEVLFLGRVRRRSRGRDVDRLDYEAYGEMAEMEMQALADAAVRDWGAVKVAMVHRCGRLEIGDVAVAIAVSATHREQAFVACRFLIDTLKQRVPIWKKERYADGEEWIAEHP
jgi:molybdopterin synthase catalytic subunit